MELKFDRNTARNVLASAVCFALTAGPVLAQTDPASDKITAAETKLLAYIALGGVAMVGIALAKVGYNVAAKWIARLGSKS